MPERYFDNRISRTNSYSTQAASRSDSIAHMCKVGASLLIALLVVFWSALEVRSQEQQDTVSGRHWGVERVRGHVTAETADGDTMVLKHGMTVRRGWKVSTGRGRVTFGRGQERFTLAPNTVATLEPKGLFISRTVIYQDRGKIDVDVTRRWYRHFRVETPFLAAVVKGTNFTVSVGNSNASVSVGRGLVNVRDFASGDRANVGAGQAVSTSPARHVGLTSSGKSRPEITAGQKRAPAFETRTVKNVPASRQEAARANSRSSSGKGSSKGLSGRSASNSSSGKGASGNSSSNSSGHGNGNAGNNGNSGNGKGNSGNGNANGRH